MMGAICRGAAPECEIAGEAVLRELGTMVPKESSADYLLKLYLGLIRNPHDRVRGRFACDADRCRIEYSPWVIDPQGRRPRRVHRRRSPARRLSKKSILRACGAQRSGNWWRVRIRPTGLPADRLPGGIAADLAAQRRGGSRTPLRLPVQLRAARASGLARGRLRDLRRLARSRDPYRDSAPARVVQTAPGAEAGSGTEAEGNPSGRWQATSAQRPKAVRVLIPGSPAPVGGRLEADHAASCLVIGLGYVFRSLISVMPEGCLRLSFFSRRRPRAAWSQADTRILGFRTPHSCTTVHGMTGLGLDCDYRLSRRCASGPARCLAR